MYSIGQARRIRGQAGDPLPPVFRAFEEKKIILRRGQTVLIVAGPGTGKSALALTYALKARVPTLYFSADSDPFTQVSRSFSVLSGVDMDDSEKYARNEPVDPDILAAALALDGVPIRFNFNASPSLDTIERAVMAFEELYGEFPSLIVIDNITNVQNGTQDNGSDPFAGLETFLDYLKTMGRETQSCVIGLHHVLGPYNDGLQPIPLSGVKGQIGRVPELILTVFRAGPGKLGVSPVKIRGGNPDTSGQTYAELSFHGETMTIEDLDDPYAQEDPFALDERRQREEQG